MITGTLNGDEYVREAARTVEALQSSQQSYMVQYGIACKELIEQGLSSLLGAKANHFVVTIEHMGSEISLKLTAVDDEGRYLYYGNESTTEVLDEGEENESIRTTPGVKGRKTEIDAIVKKAERDAKMLMGSLGARI